MNDIAVSVERLGKQYRLGAQRMRYRRFSEEVTDSLKYTLKRIRRTAPPRPAPEMFWALKDVSFQVAQGEVLGIIGRNGAGKSTILKVLSRITEMTEGRVELAGRVRALLEVGTGFHPELTGRENVYLNGGILGMTRGEIRSKFDEIVAFAEIERFLDTPVKRYSSGMYVRLAFAVAAHLEPEILIIDEVLAVGDVAFQTKCLAKITEVAHQGRTVIIVSHVMSSIRALCSRAILLNAGRLALEGDVETVISNYLQLDKLLERDGEIPADLPRPVGTFEAMLRRVDLRDPDTDQSIREVFMAQTIRIVMIYEVVKRVEAAVVEVGIATLDGTRIETTFNINENQPAFPMEPGFCEIQVDLEANLLPNRYVIDVFIHALGGLTIDWVTHALQFTVMDVTKAGDESYFIQQQISNPIRGYIRPKAVWQLPKKIG